ncbi:hypothetical protein [Casimicrobium huifangae]|jgi:hypothetical protein|uniref:hypothetical protein n=2 Tax=Casimicrobium huifangae TaxID=2591109 RepID=UPI0037834964
MAAHDGTAGKRGNLGMIESGFWIFLVETLGIGGMFVALIWWVVRGSDSRHRKLAEHDAKAAAEAGKNPTSDTTPKT